MRNANILGVLLLAMAANDLPSMVPCAICGTADPFRQYSPSDVGVVCNLCRDAELLKRGGNCSDFVFERGIEPEWVSKYADEISESDEAIAKAIDKRERRRLRNIRNEARRLGKCDGDHPAPPCGSAECWHGGDR